MALEVIDYTPPPILKKFVGNYTPNKLFYDWIVGPVGSGKTTGLFFKLVRMAKLQEPAPDGKRYTRAVVVRNTAQQLKDTTLKSWSYWFKSPQAGSWAATDKTFTLEFGDVVCEVLFRPLDTPDDVSRVLSLEVTFAILDEFVQIPKEIVEGLSGRCGRYPPKKLGGATNFGMWGSSNPDTEDNWWFDYLHKQCRQYSIDFEDGEAGGIDYKNGDPTSNATYYKQPSGFADDAENISNLPPEYYDNLAKNKSDTWIKQFIDAEWGFSVAGKPVVPSFKPAIHVAKQKLLYNPRLKLVAGFDPGLGGSAFVFGQQDLHGRLVVLGEIVETGMSVERLIRERLAPYLANKFPNADFVIAPDPAAANRTQTDERSVVDILKRYFAVSTESNNRLPLRLNAIEHFTSMLVGVGDGAALLIDEQECPTLVRALKGGWRFAIDPKRDVIKGAEPEKNPYSHPGDAFGYLCRYFHKQGERYARWGVNPATGVPKFQVPRFTSGGYHYR